MWSSLYNKDAADGRPALLWAFFPGRLRLCYKWGNGVDERGEGWYHVVRKGEGSHTLLTSAPPEFPVVLTGEKRGLSHSNLKKEEFS